VPSAGDRTRELASAAFGLYADMVLGAEIPFAKLYNLCCEELSPSSLCIVAVREIDCRSGRYRLTRSALSHELDVGQ